jgi:PilZ domain
MMDNVDTEVITEQHAVRSYSQARRHDRFPVDFLVSLRWPGMRLADRALDLSEGGLCVQTAQPLHPMTLISMRLEVPPSEAPIDLLGRVMWTRDDTMGIRFESSDPRLFDAIGKMRQDFDRL